MSAISKVRGIARLIDALARAQPGTTSCPLDTGSSVTFAFERHAGGRSIATVKADAGGCGSVTVRIHGTTMPTLSGGAALVRHVASLLSPRARRRLRLRRVAGS